MASDSELRWGERLQIARRRAGYATQQALGDAVGRGQRTIRLWEAREGPLDDPAMLAELHDLLGDFDSARDPVVVALDESPLTEDRALEVRAHYKRLLREQHEAEERRSVG